MLDAVEKQMDWLDFKAFCREAATLSGPAK
jgi:hypothetical protein